MMNGKVSRMVKTTITLVKSANTYCVLRMSSIYHATD